MKNPLVIIIGILVLAVMVIQISGQWKKEYTVPKPTNTYNINSNNGVACTDDAKQCPDGSYVGRTGPQCQFADCPNTPVITPQANGSLSGHIYIGPICPVESMPPNPNCLPNSATYAAHPIYVYTANRSTLLHTLIANRSGNFSVSLAPGRYLVDVTHSQVGSVSGVPTTITIVSGQAITVNINIDTGIR